MHKNTIIEMIQMLLKEVPYENDVELQQLAKIQMQLETFKEE